MWCRCTLGGLKKIQKLSQTEMLIMRATIRIVGVSVAVFLVSCKMPGELDRKEAAAVISKSFLDSPVSQVREHPSAFMDGMAEGLWDNRGQRNPNAGTSIVQRANGYLTLATPLRRTVTQVTGIASPVTALVVESSSMKEVQFEWAYVGAEGVIKRLAAQGGTGVAILRKFDDGWRLAEIKTTDTDKPFILTAADTLERDSLRKEAARVRAEEQAIFDVESRREGEDAAMEELRQQARKPTVSLGTYRAYVPSGGATIENPVMLTDVGYQAKVGGIFFADYVGVEPIGSETISDGKIIWYHVRLHEDEGMVLFKDMAERDRFLIELKRSMTTWRAKYPTLK